MATVTRSNATFKGVVEIRKPPEFKFVGKTEPQTSDVSILHWIKGRLLDRTILQVKIQLNGNEYCYVFEASWQSEYEFELIRQAATNRLYDLRYKSKIYQPVSKKGQLSKHDWVKNW